MSASGHFQPFAAFANCWAVQIRAGTWFRTRNVLDRFDCSLLAGECGKRVVFHALRDISIDTHRIDHAIQHAALSCADVAIFERSA